MLTAKLNTPGQHGLLLPGIVGLIEAELTVPEHFNHQYVAVLGHPHSLQGGSMQNKVVTTLVRTYKDLGIASLRFNFRGVGHTAGVYDDGFGESDDMLFLAKQFIDETPAVTLIFAGFSFGSYVAYRAAAQCPHALLVTIAPSVEHYNYEEFSTPPSPWIVAQGDSDEVVPAPTVIAFAKRQNPPLPVLMFEGTSHFFHGKLIDLKTRLLMTMGQLGIC